MFYNSGCERANACQARISCTAPTGGSPCTKETTEKEGDIIHNFYEEIAGKWKNMIGEFMKSWDCET